MIIQHHRHFTKYYRKRILPYPERVQRFNERLNLFLKNPTDPILKDHKLQGKLREYRAFSITGDIRAVYKIIDGTIELYDIGTHNQVY